jgi:hypothetical protein
MRTIMPEIIGAEQRAWVVFSGETDLFLLRFLKPGFRHCFLLLNDGQCWVSYDPMAHHTEILVHHMPSFFDLPGWLEGRGHRVIEAQISKVVKKPAPPSLFSCVEAVKRVLGIHRAFVVTPWQLYRHLNAAPHNNGHGHIFSRSLNALRRFIPINLQTIFTKKGVSSWEA